MASRRKFKKQIKDKTNLLIEDAFIEAINGDEKEADKMDSIIDKVVDDRHEMLNRVCDYPSNDNRSNIKQHFKAIREDLNKKVEEHQKKIGIVK